MFLAACLAAAYPAAAAADGTSVLVSAGTAPVNCMPEAKPAPCYSPQAYQAAYGIAPLLSHGIDGHGETVVTPELASSVPATDIRQDLATFDSTFGLPPAKLQVVNTIARSAAPYLAGDEEVGDTEMVHAIAPGVARHAAVISISASGGEHSLTRAEATAMNQALEQARQQHVTVAASSGDEGAISSHEGPPVQVNMPASDPLVPGSAAPSWTPVRVAPTWARWPGTTTPKPPTAATAACSPARPTRTAWLGPAPPAASPM